MELDTLFEMVEAAAKNASRVCTSAGQNTGSLMGYVGFETYLNEYNKFVPLVIEQFGDEADRLFRPVEVPDVEDVLHEYDQWVKLSELAAVRLSEMAAYLRSKLGATDRQVQGLMDLVRGNLRPAVYEPPEREKETQNALDTIFRARGLDYQREQVTIPYSSKRFIPDFTFESLNLALEVKLCKSAEQEKSIIDEINADIPAYQSRYRYIIFVVYDLGSIQDEHQFKSSIESNPDVHVLVVKH